MFERERLARSKLRRELPDSGDAVQGLLSLTLLVPGIAAHDEYDAATAHDFALIADSFDARFYFHRSTRGGGGRAPGKSRSRMAVNA
jgi:hypothetical protein